MNFVFSIITNVLRIYYNSQVAGTVGELFDFRKEVGKWMLLVFSPSLYNALKTDEVPSCFKRNRILKSRGGQFVGLKAFFV